MDPIRQWCLEHERNVTRIILESPIEIIIEQALKFEFKANNQEEYKALIASMILTLEIGASILKSKSGSKLVTNQVVGQYHAKQPQLIKYLHKVRSLSICFTSFEVENVPRE